MSKSIFIPLLLILVLGAFFRFYFLTEYPLGLYPDEAMNGNNALEALATGDFKIFYPENNGREGLFINIQALSLWVFGNEAWALRLISALFGTLTILGVYLLTRELFNSYFVALLASFLLASSYWHVNFSRIGFRAIMVPFLATFGMYFLLKGLRQGKILPLVWAGIFVGLGFHTYIAFRFFPLVLLIPIIWYLWQYQISNIKNQNDRLKSDCAPCAVLLFLLVAFVAALPMGYYFFQNPQDFLGRAGDVSIFSAESPLAEFIKSNIATLGMFFANGDCNWRHNFNCQPELHPLVAFFFPLGILVTIWRSFPAGYKSRREVGIPASLSKGANSASRLQATSLLAWFLFMMLPATLTREGLPHALRAIGMIPPVMIFSGIGVYSLIKFVKELLERQKERRPEASKIIGRIQKEFTLAVMLILLFIPLSTYTTYFLRWSQNPNTYFAFSADLWHLGEYLDVVPVDIKKYVVVNLSGVEVRGFPMPAQTVMFATDTFWEEKRREKNFTYLLPEEAKSRRFETEERVVVAMLDGTDRELASAVRQKNPEFRVWAPGDFVVLQNY